MKKILFGSAMLAVLALVGCKKEQSQLTLDSLSGVAKVQGKITYDAGVRGSEATKDGIVVALEIDCSQFDDAAKGVKQYTTQTDVDGNYAFEVPAGVDAITAKVVVMPFYANYAEQTTFGRTTETSRLYTPYDYPEVTLKSQWLAECNIQLEPTLN